jgi:hypothetical protein
MAAFPKPTPLSMPSVATLAFGNEHKISGLYTGVQLASFDACYIAAAGTVLQSTGAAANAAAKVRGFAMTPANPATNDAVTLVHSVVVGWVNTVTPGTDLYLSGTVAGGLDTAASTGGTSPIGFVIDANRVFLKASGY